jgi:hypothetical protein
MLLRGALYANETLIGRAKILRGQARRSAAFGVMFAMRGRPFGPAAHQPRAAAARHARGSAPSTIPRVVAERATLGTDADAVTFAPIINVRTRMLSPRTCRATSGVGRADTACRRRVHLAGRRAAAASLLLPLQAWSRAHASAPRPQGCWQLAGGHGREVFDGIEDKLAAHAAAGFTTFDTADIYVSRGAPAPWAWRAERAPRRVAGPAAAGRARGWQAGGPSTPRRKAAR